MSLCRCCNSPQIVLALVVVVSDVLEMVLFCVSGTASRGHGPPQALPGSILSPQLRALTAALYALPEFGGSDRSQARLDPQALQQMLQNPTVQQMMRGLLSNPQYIDEVLT